MKPLALQFAMEKEAQGVLDALGLKPKALSKKSPLPFVYYVGKVGGAKVVASVSGKDPRHGTDNIGLESATLQTYALIEAFKPRMVINAGTAGSFASLGAAVGDVYLSRDCFVFHDHRVPLGGFAARGEGRYPSSDTAAIAEALGLKRGMVSSGSSLDYTERDLEVFHALGATLKEMEAAAIGYVCDLLRVPVIAVKAVTNLLDRTPDSAAAFSQNLEVACAALTYQVPKVVRFLVAQKSH
jgi:nucleoside phosphorylase